MNKISIEEIKKSRYKIIADYPDTPFNKGEIICIPYHDKTEAFYDRWPHLFKRLKWWEERKKTEMPQYLGYSAWIGLDGDMTEFNGEYEEVIEVKQHLLRAFDGKKFLSMKGDVIDYCVWYPATKEQFEAINKQK